MVPWQDQAVSMLLKSTFLKKYIYKGKKGKEKIQQRKTQRAIVSALISSHVILF